MPGRFDICNNVSNEFLMYCGIQAHHSMKQVTFAEKCIHRLNQMYSTELHKDATLDNWNAMCSGLVGHAAILP